MCMCVYLLVYLWLDGEMEGEGKGVKCLEDGEVVDYKRGGLGLIYETTN